MIIHRQKMNWYPGSLTGQFGSGKKQCGRGIFCGTTITAAGDADGSYTLKASALSYVRSVLNKSASTEEAKNAVSALYQYYEAVKAYNS